MTTPKTTFSFLTNLFRIQKLASAKSRHTKKLEHCLNNCRFLSLAVVGWMDAFDDFYHAAFSQSAKSVQCIEKLQRDALFFARKRAPLLRRVIMTHHHRTSPGKKPTQERLKIREKIPRRLLPTTFFRFFPFFTGTIFVFGDRMHFYLLLPLLGGEIGKTILILFKCNSK